MFTSSRPIRTKGRFKNSASWPSRPLPLEVRRPRASCCHGFASYVALWLMELKEKLGL